MDNKKPIKIYLGDLTYDTVTISTESFPLNIGYIASYCNSIFKNKIEIKLFKYIDKLEKAILENPPDILGLSNYVWCKRISLEMFRLAKEHNCEVLNIWGGPNFPIEYSEQKKFMQNNNLVDIYVPGEGEVAFSNILKKIFSLDEITNFKTKILASSIEGCIIRKNDGEIDFTLSLERITDLDVIPSPYLTNLFTEFFDGKLSPMLQTNRGCPFLCTYCVDGSKDVNIVNKFSLDRIKQEIEFIAKNSSNNGSLIITDLNFGMIPRDDLICDYLVESQNNFNYPNQIQVTTGKNSKDRIIRSIKKLKDTIRFYMSVQSLDENVLINVKRNNISVDQMLKLRPTIIESGLRTTSEVILGLPGETLASYIETLRKLVQAEINDIQVFQCMLLDGSELNSTKEKEKWNLKTKFRILPRDFIELKNGKKIVEIEEIVIGSNQLSFDDYLYARLIAFSIWVTNKGIIYDPLIHFLRENQIDVFELFLRTITDVNQISPDLTQLFEQLKNSTKNELWDSADQIEKFYQSDENFKKLLTGEDGINIFYYFHSLVLSSYLESWSKLVFKISENLLVENKKFNEHNQKKFIEICNYCKGLSYKPFTSDRKIDYYEEIFNYDIDLWLNSKEKLSIENFKFDIPKRITFQYGDEQISFVNEKIRIFGSSQNGLSQAIKRIPLKKLWRTPIVL